MKFRVERDALADAVAWTAKSLPSRPSVPVLAGFWLRVADGMWQVSGFDYEVSSQVTVDVHADADGAALVSGRLLAEITKALPAKPVDVAAVGSHVEITCGSARFTLPTMPVEDYPTLPEMPATAGTVDAATFAAAVAQVAIAAGRDDTPPLLTGVRVELTGNTLALLATDRYRLAVRELEWRPDDPGVNVAALVPARTLADTAKALGPLGGSVTVALARGGVGEGMIGFSGATRRTTSRLLEGEFPKVRSLRPDTHSAQAKVPVAALQEVVRRVALVAERATPVRLSFSDDGLVVEAGGSEDARASEAMDCAYSGEPMTIAFNHQYLLDGLAALDGPVAVMSFTDAKKPAIVAPATEEIAGLLDQGDLIIDGGNSRYTDDLARAPRLAERGIGYLDVGVSGGIWGRENGYALMVGGAEEHVARCMPIFEALKPEGEFGFVHAGGVGAGHYAKRVHNGSEYGLMPAYGEGYELLAASEQVTNVPGVIKSWRSGTVIRSWLLDLLDRALDEDPELAGIRGYAEDTGEGRWTVEEAIRLAVPLNVIADALFARFASRQEDSPTIKAVAALRNQFGGHAIRK